VKYVCRHNLKGGLKDLLKARHYIDLLIEWEYEGSDTSCVSARHGKEDG